MKLCFRCFKVIPALASKCPNCLDMSQGTWGRIALLILAAATAIWLLDRCADRRWPFEKPAVRVQRTDRAQTGDGRGAWQPILPGW